MGLHTHIFSAKYTHFPAENLHIFAPKILYEVYNMMIIIALLDQTSTFGWINCTHLASEIAQVT